MAYSMALEALADPTRRTVFELLRSGPRAVGELAARLPVSRPAVSQHLRVLWDAGLVQMSEEGTRHVYRADPAGLEELRAYFEGFWQDALDAFASYAEQEEGKRWHKRRSRRSRGR